MNLKNKIFILIFFQIWMGCTLFQNTSKVLGDSSDFIFKRDSTKTFFTLLQLNDVYEISPIQNNEFGGMARVETLRKELTEENENTMLVLAGDFLNPSLLGTLKVDGERVKGRQMIEVMNAMNMELVAFGNHEFDLSYEELQQRINESDFAWISANVLQVINGKHHYFHKVVDGRKQSLQDTFIKTFQNSDGSLLKVGFISVCIPSNPKDYVFYGDIYDEIQRSYREIVSEVDIVLGLTHVSIEQDKEIAKLLPNVPLIMGGHEHENIKIKEGNVVITKADANAKTAYIHRFSYDPKTKELNFTSQLKQINKNIPKDVNVDNIVKRWESILDLKLKEVIANPQEVISRPKEALDGRDSSVRSMQTNLGSIIAKAMYNAYENYDIDGAIVNGGSIRIDDWLKGEVRAVDIFKVLPYGGPILKVQMKGSLLKKVLDFGEEAKGTGAYLQRENIKNEDNIWKINHKELDLNKTYTVVTSDYLMKGLDIPFLDLSHEEVIDVYSPLSKANEESDIRKVVITYLKKNTAKKK